MTAPDPVQALTERIAAVLREHGQLETSSIWDECRCRWRPGLDAAEVRRDHCAHVAAVLIAELGLTQQWGAATLDDPDAPVPYFGPGRRSEAEADAADLDGGCVATRWVTAWERAQ